LAGKGLAAGILVGGQSRRMGRDKALLPILPDGTTIVETVVRKLCGITNDILLVGTNRDACAFPGLPVIADDPAGIGPLGGLRAALRATRQSHVLVVACDMPLLHPQLLGFMAGYPRDYDVLLPDVGQPQPLHAIYARTCLPAIEQRIESGQYRVTGLLEDLKVRTIDRETVEQFDPACRSWFNVNTPEDYEWARHLMAAEPD